MSDYLKQASATSPASRPANNELPAGDESLASVAASANSPDGGIYAEHEWDQSLQQAAALEREVSDEVVEQKHKRGDIEALANKLRIQIERMRHQHAGLSQMAGEVEAHQTNQINALMSMIASLSRSMDQSRSRELPEYRQISGVMQRLEGRLSLQRQQQSSDRSGAEQSLTVMKREQSALERELVIIHQQLSALHSRLMSLGAI